MNIKKENGLSGIDVVISVIIITIFITLIGNLIINMNANTHKTKNESDATLYAVKEIEDLKAKKYISDYDGQGINSEEILKINNVEQDEDINENGKFTGYHKTIYIQDYANEYKQSNPSGTETINENILKKLTVEITYNFAGKKQSVKLSIYISSAK